MRAFTPSRARRRALVVLAAATLAGACHRDPAVSRASASAEPVSSASSSTRAPLPAPGKKPAPSALRGAELYARTCAVCHGAHGEGYRADAAPALSQPGFLSTVSDEFLDFAISIGRTKTPMSAWRTDQGGPLTETDVRSVIAFLRTWQKGPATTYEPGHAPGDPGRGKVIFAAHCARCHGPKGSAVHILNRQWLTFARPAFIRYAIAKGRPPTPMKGFENTLGDAGVEDVLAYLRSLPAWLVPGELAGSSKPPPIPLGPVPLNPHGPVPAGFHAYPAMTPVATIWGQFQRHARMTVIDARAPSDYKRLHIAGAVSVPFYDPSPYLDRLPRSDWIVCYCGCPHAESIALARQLIEAGFTKVAILDEGFGAWTAAGHPTRMGLAP